MNNLQVATKGDTQGGWPAASLMGYHPMQVWAAIPPWGVEQIFLTPLNAELIETMKPLRK